MSLLINQAKYPTEFALHQKYAQHPLLLDLVWTHANCVAAVVTNLYQHPKSKLEFPLPLAIQASLYLDLGIYLCRGYEWLTSQVDEQFTYDQHTTVGAWLLYKENQVPEVIQAAYSHTGTHLPQTQFQQFMSYASKFHSKTPRFKTAEEIRAGLAHIGNESVALFNSGEDQFGLPNLTECSAPFIEWHRAFAFDQAKASGLVAA